MYECILNLDSSSFSVYSDGRIRLTPDKIRSFRSLNAKLLSDLINNGGLTDNSGERVATPLGGIPKVQLPQDKRGERIGPLDILIDYAAL